MQSRCRLLAVLALLLKASRCTQEGWQRGGVPPQCACCEVQKGWDVALLPFVVRDAPAQMVHGSFEGQWRGPSAGPGRLGNASMSHATGLAHCAHECLNHGTCGGRVHTRMHGGRGNGGGGVSGCGDAQTNTTEHHVYGHTTHDGLRLGLMIVTCPCAIGLSIWSAPDVCAAAPAQTASGCTARRASLACHGANCRTLATMGEQGHQGQWEGCSMPQVMQGLMALVSPPAVAFCAVVLPRLTRQA